MHLNVYIYSYSTPLIVIEKFWLQSYLSLLKIYWLQIYQLTLVILPIIECRKIIFLLSTVLKVLCLRAIMASGRHALQNWIWILNLLWIVMLVDTGKRLVLKNFRCLYIVSTNLHFYLYIVWYIHLSSVSKPA